MRKVACEFCFVEFPIQDLPEHKRYCGSKSISCSLCNQPVAARKMELHMATQHGINPCLEAVPDSRPPRSSVIPPSRSQSQRQGNDDIEERMLQEAILASQALTQPSSSSSSSSSRSGNTRGRGGRGRGRGRNQQQRRTTRDRTPPGQRNIGGHGGGGGTPMDTDDWELQQALLASMNYN